MPVYTTTPQPGFWIAMADADGNKTSVETRLAPGPTRIEYPNASLGDVVETADGRVVVQVTNRDPRRRSWIWSNFSPVVTPYERQYRWLQQLMARRRLALGFSPYIYVYDGTTNLLSVPRSYQTAVTTQSGVTLTIPTLPNTIAPNNLKNAVAEVMHDGASVYPYERRSITAATSTQLTLENPLSGSLSGSSIMISWSEPAWWKARVIDVIRELREDGGMVRYPVTRFTFVLDEEIPA